MKTSTRCGMGCTGDEGGGRAEDDGEDFDSLRNGKYEPWKSSVKIRSLRDEVRLPEEFDREFDRLDA